MGKPFLVELSHLGETYAWTLDQDVSSLTDFFRSALDRPILAVGSGGSLSAASYAAFLHEQIAGFPSEALTPMRFVGFNSTPDVAALFLSAGGRNHDILAAIRAASIRDLRQVGAMSLRTTSPLVDLAEKIAGNLFSASPPTGGDGFLATNSLIAFFGLIFRALAAIQPHLGKLPPTFRELTDTATFNVKALQRVVAHQHLVVLYGPSTASAAIDLESKFHEAGLASIQLADFRNFAHGRHNWIAKNREATAVIALVAPETKSIADATLDILQTQVSVAQIHCSGRDSLHSFAALGAVFEATSLAGIARNIDPGRPGVPPFGRRIYNLRGFRDAPRLSRKSDLAVAAHRKVGNAWTSLSPSHKAKWISAGETYLERLAGAGFQAVTFDFDGTLCSKKERFDPLNKRVVTELERLLRGGVRVGIATGRGQSVREQMRQSIRRDLWGRIWIGYYNGSDIAGLADDDHPDLRRPPAESLLQLSASMKRDGIVRTIAKVESRPTQITLEPTVSIGLDELYRHAVALARRGPPGLKVLMSSHSVDIIPLDVSKTAVVRFMSSLCEPSGATLCIGDAGEYPGNDFELLSEPYSLSCDQVSADSLTCWNFAPSSLRGVEATLFYLRHLFVRKGTAALRIPSESGK
jgi:haloacid dehalogenase-like hydrolase